MIFYCVERDKKQVFDFFITLSLKDEFDDFLFPPGDVKFSDNLIEHGSVIGKGVINIVLDKIASQPERWNTI